MLHNILFLFFLFQLFFLCSNMLTPVWTDCADGGMGGAPMSHPYPSSILPCPVNEQVRVNLFIVLSCSPCSHRQGVEILQFLYAQLYCVWRNNVCIFVFRLALKCTWGSLRLCCPVSRSTIRTNKSISSTKETSTTHLLTAPVSKSCTP